MRKLLRGTLCLPGEDVDIKRSEGQHIIRGGSFIRILQHIVPLVFPVEMDILGDALFDPGYQESGAEGKGDLFFAHDDIQIIIVLLHKGKSRGPYGNIGNLCFSFLEGP